MRIAFAVVSCLILAGYAQAQPAPSGPPPTLKVVKAIEKDKGNIVFLETVTRAVPVFVERVEIVNGQQVTKKVMQVQYITEQRFQSVPAASSRVITAAGKQLPIDEVWKQVKPNTVIAVSGDGNTPAAAYLKALNADILILIPARPQGVVVPAPVPMPIPGDLPPPPKQ